MNGAIGKHDSIALTERAIRTFKNGCSRRILVPVARTEMEEEVGLFFHWYNEYRPHMSLNGELRMNLPSASKKHLAKDRNATFG